MCVCVCVDARVIKALPTAVWCAGYSVSGPGPLLAGPYDLLPPRSVAVANLDWRCHLHWFVVSLSRTFSFTLTFLTSTPHVRLEIIHYYVSYFHFQ